MNRHYLERPIDGLGGLIRGARASLEAVEKHRLLQRCRQPDAPADRLLRDPTGVQVIEQVVRGELFVVLTSDEHL